MRRSHTIIFFVIAFCSCNSPSIFEENFEKMRWMEGSWTMLADGKSMTEIWNFKTDTSISGTNYFVVDTDTFQTEDLSIKVVDSSIYYIAKLASQNEGVSIPFLMTKNEGGIHLFVNPNHDFPNNILYENIGDTMMRATVSGHIDGEYREQQYRMIKQSN